MVNFFELDGQRKFDKALFVGGTPFGHVGAGLELHALHVGTAERGGHNGDEKTEVAEQRGYLPQAKMTHLPQGNEPHDGGEEEIDEHKRPKGEHLRESDGIDGSLVGRHLASEPHHHGEHGSIEKSGHGGFGGEEETEQAHPAAQHIDRKEGEEEENEENGVEREGEVRPPHRPDGRLQRQPDEEESCAEGKTFFHFPNMVEHGSERDWSERGDRGGKSAAALMRKFKDVSGRGIPLRVR